MEFSKSLPATERRSQVKRNRDNMASGIGIRRNARWLLRPTKIVSRYREHLFTLIPKSGHDALTQLGNGELML